MVQKPERRFIEVRSFKWPRRPTSVTIARLLGEDHFGRWLGVARGDLWWSADRSCNGVFEQSLVKLVPDNTFWTVCFHPVEPVVDVDIVLPVHWAGDVLEEIDLELDILRCTDGRVQVRDQDKFEQVRTTWAMPAEMVAQAIATGEWVRMQVEQGNEPFGTVGKLWLSRFLDQANRGNEQ